MRNKCTQFVVISLLKGTLMASKGTTLTPDGYLGVNDFLLSANGQYRALLQADGNFVLYRGNAVLWQSQSARGQGVYTAMLQPDGNFVVYTGTPSQPQEAIWASDSAQEGGTYVLKLENDGNLEIHRRSPIWTQSSAEAPPEDQGKKKKKSKKKAVLGGILSVLGEVGTEVLEDQMEKRRTKKRDSDDQ